jgi:hypothetical protein
MQHKLAACNFYIHSMLSLHITELARHSEWKMICNIAHNNAFPTRLLHNIRNKILRIQNAPLTTPHEHRKNLATFTFHSPFVYKITKMFRNTNINITSKPTNTIHHFLQNHPTTDKLQNSGTYRLQCNTCNRSYVGQSGRSISIRHKEHLRYIKTKNQVSAYATHTLNDQHEFSPSKQTLQLLQPCTKCNILNQCESFYIYPRVAQPEFVDR